MMHADRPPAAPLPQTTPWTRLKLAATSVWPDGFIAALIAVAALVTLTQRDGYERLTIARLIPGVATDFYVVSIALACVTILSGVATRRAVLASRGAVLLSLMLAFNGIAIFLSYKGDAALSMAVYFAAALLTMNRSFVLSRRQLVPWWLAAPPAVRGGR
jgi:hypothetical protein